MKKILKNILVFISYFVFDILLIIIQSLLIYIFKLYNINLSSNIAFKSIYLISGSLLYMIFILLIYKEEIKNDLNDLKIKGINLIVKYIPIYIIGILLMGFTNISLQGITNIPVSDNEEAVRQTIKLLPIYMSFSVSLFAPIVEEIIFRKTFRNIINNNYLFIVISGIIFGLVHITGNININAFLMSIPYMIMGIDFAYIYYKSENIFTTMILHSIHNTVLLIFQFIGG